jgi:hypothetical protein
LVNARRAFASQVPEVKTFRDFFEHLDQYAIGEGRLQTLGRMDADVRGAVAYMSPGSVTGEIWLVLGDLNLPVKEAARASLVFADALRVVLDDAQRAFFEDFFGPRESVN